MMPLPIKNAMRHTWWHRKKDNCVYFVCEVGFGYVYLVRLYSEVASKINEVDFINEVNKGTFKQYNINGSLQE